jgi:hypothetical protein
MAELCTHLDQIQVLASEETTCPECVPDLTTTVLTMTLTGLAAESPFAGGTGLGTVRRTSAVVAMLVGALVGALLLKVSLSLVVVVACVSTAVTFLGYRRTADDSPSTATTV